MRKITGSIFSLVVVLVLMLAAILLSLRFEYAASKLLPLTIGGTVLILTIIALVMEILAGSGQDARSEKGKTAEGEDAPNRGKVYLGMAGWIFGFALAIYVFGFMISTPVFVGAYMKRHGSGWPGVVITAGIFSVIFYIVFNVALQADLYSGRLLMWLG
ncbi:MAG: tripartite tricarboxylate transporter TctB family protein [Pseudomonadota bacterium]